MRAAHTGCLMKRCQSIEGKRHRPPKEAGTETEERKEISQQPAGGEHRTCTLTFSHNPEKYLYRKTRVFAERGKIDCFL